MTAGSPVLEAALAAATDTRRLVTGSGVLARTADVFRDLCPGRSAVLVADRNTFAAAGSPVGRSLSAAGIPLLPAFVFDDPDLYAEHRFVEQLEAALAAHSAVPLAVGSGTINDLTKLAAHRTGRPSLAVATAASMDGYTAYGSSITFLGSKQTFDCPAPLGVIADLDVIRRAPAGMNAWGYADLTAKVTAGADWLLADALGMEPIDAHAWSVVQDGLREALSDPQGVRDGDECATGRLVDGLMLGGFAMQAMRSSRPASGAEHQFSHLWDMQHHTHNGAAPSHGAKVGIATLAVTALYEAILTMPPDSLFAAAARAPWPEEAGWQRQAAAAFPDAQLLAVARREIAAKYRPAGSVRETMLSLPGPWPTLSENLCAQLVPFDALRDRLAAAGAPTAPEAIGISRQRLRDSFLQAFFVRRRFTVLDFAVQAGVLDSCLDRLFGPHGPWPISPTDPPTATAL